MLLSAHGLAGGMWQAHGNASNGADFTTSGCTGSDGNSSSTSVTSSSTNGSSATSSSDSSSTTSTAGEHLVFLFGSSTAGSHQCGADSERSHCSSSSDSGSSDSTSASSVTGTAGEALPSFQVAVENQSGDVVKSDNTSTVTLSVASGPADAVVDSNSTMTATAKNGIATFDNVILDTAGTYTLTATDSNAGVTSAVSGTITVNPGAATQLVVQPVTTPSTVGQTISPAITVTAEDAFGNVATSDDDSVTLNVASGSSGSFTSESTPTVQAVNGVATFDNIALDTASPLPAGTQPYFLFATQGSLTSPNSNAIEILAS